LFIHTGKFYARQKIKRPKIPCINQPVIQITHQSWLGFTGVTRVHFPHEGRVLDNPRFKIFLLSSDCCPSKTSIFPHFPAGDFSAVSG
jgi:hypothetical protein